MASAQAAENDGNEWDFTWYFSKSNINNSFKLKVYIYIIYIYYKIICNVIITLQYYIYNYIYIIYI